MQRAWADGEGRLAVLEGASITASAAALLEAASEPATARQLALRRFSAWLVEEDESDADRLLDLEAPELDAEVVEPLTAQQVKALVAAQYSPDATARARDHGSLTEQVHPGSSRVSPAPGHCRRTAADRRCAADTV